LTTGDRIALAVLTLMIMGAAAGLRLFVIRGRKISRRCTVVSTLLATAAAWTLLASVYGGGSVIINRPEVTSTEAAAELGFLSEFQYPLAAWGETPHEPSWFTIDPQAMRTQTGDYMVYWYASHDAPPTLLILPENEVWVIHNPSSSITIDLDDEKRFNEKETVSDSGCRLGWDGILPVCRRVVEYRVILDDDTRLGGLGPIVRYGLSEPEERASIRLIVDAATLAALEAKVSR
jgi:hypothetical protein